eukprot:scaffold146109_cov19-Prasinocladus_malaysianus.AAC.1
MISPIERQKCGQTGSLTWRVLLSKLGIAEPSYTPAGQRLGARHLVLQRRHDSRRAAEGPG